ncbi:PPC domain-containing DNA-binding protein [Pedobacter psychrophilus]|nr:PPC domain-containing DNA-binding protein [Pedobacter psychrophilus]
MKKIILGLLICLLSTYTMAQSSTSKSYAFRLKPGEDLKVGIEKFLTDHKIKAAAIVTVVGSLTDANIRYANQPEGKLLKGHFEITSLTGVLSTNGSHMHISIANEKGKTFGGHLLDGCKVYTTAEIVILELMDLEFKREIDPTFGYKELVVEQIKK